MARGRKLFPAQKKSTPSSRTTYARREILSRTLAGDGSPSSFQALGPRDVRCEGQGFSDKVERSLSEVRVVKPKLSVRSAVNLSNPVHLPVVFFTKTQTGKVAGWIGRRCRVCREWLASRASPRFDSLGDRPTPSPSGVRVRFVGRACEGVEKRGQPSIVGSTGLVSTDRARNWPHFPSGLITCQVFSVVRVADSFSLPALLVGGSLDLSVAPLGPS